MPRGGLRRNAGRKPSEITELKRTATKNFAALILSDESERNRWRRALDSENEKVALDALTTLSEFKHGRAKQSLDVDANVNLVASVVVNV